MQYILSKTMINDDVKFYDPFEPPEATDDVSSRLATAKANHCLREAVANLLEALEEPCTRLSTEAEQYRRAIKNMLDE